MMIPSRALAAASLFALSAPALAQFNDPWVGFSDQSAARLPGGSVSSFSDEADLAWADLDQDGFTDLVVARKMPFSTAGRRTNVLLMNEGGVLVDRTALFAHASDLARIHHQTPVWMWFPISAPVGGTVRWPGAPLAA